MAICSTFQWLLFCFMLIAFSAGTRIYWLHTNKLTKHKKRSSNKIKLNLLSCIFKQTEGRPSFALCCSFSAFVPLSYVSVFLWNSPLSSLTFSVPSLCLSVCQFCPSPSVSLSLSLSIDSHCLSSVSLFHPRLSGFFCSLALFPSLNLTGDPFFHHTLPISLPFLLVRWFEEPGPICELLAKASKIEVSEIKSPIGSICQKYVYSSFMVKMRIDLGPFGLFWFILGWG